MKNRFLKTTALVLALVLCVSVLPVFHIDAAAAGFSYVYDSTGTYIYNWGTRGSIATELSPNATAFYKNQSAYDVLSAYTGGTGVSNAPTSELYLALQKVMKDAHKHQTSYNETRDLYMYTDCQNSGGKISSFYSGKAIGPSWDGGSTWNREHTWPNSKGLGGNDENDIMMLRPTSVSENSSRGNKAYGKSGGYYNPNSTSNNTYDLRGDVARIFLYVYVRWGNVNGNGESGSSGAYTTWGTNGVMESKDVLLEWMEADPVDTWEMGRNDSVQTITGTRNVFVDYPEFAFLLFGEQVPADMTTPSGEGGNACNHNNFDAGVVTPPTCSAKGYTTYTCKTAGCNYSYRTAFVNTTAHNYVGGICSACGASDPDMKITYTSEIAVGQPYKLGLFSTNKNDEYFFNGTMSGYYGATDTDHTKAVDVYAETATGGYYLYFKDSNNAKQYINLVASGTHRNFTFAPTATSVFVWDDQRDSLYTTVSGETCYMGTYGSYVTMSVLRDSLIQDTDYFAHLYVVPTAKPIVKQGWKLEGGKWYFYESGVKVVNKWMKDSKGWVKLGADGAMITNKWVTDSKGWCYVGGDGYAVTNCWKKDSKGWIYLDANGSMTKSKWVLSSGKWYYCDAAGYMVVNKWQKDSKGWVKLGADGAMLTNKWTTDSKGWCYVGADGYAVTNCWKKDSTGWIWLDANGSMTKSKWVKDGGEWYYCDANGYMVANKSMKIGNKTYKFNASGVCTNP